MKKIFLSKITMSLFSGAALLGSTSHAVGLISYRINAGAGYGNEAGTNAAGTAVTSSYKLSYFGGVGLDIGAGPLGVIVDALYAMRTLDVDNDTILDMTRLEFPVVARFSTGMISFMAGGYWAMVLGDPTVSVAGATAVATTLMSTSDYGAVAGISFGIPAGLAKLKFDLRYNFGLANLIATPATDQKETYRSIDLMASLNF